MHRLQTGTILTLIIGALLWVVASAPLYGSEVLDVVGKYESVWTSPPTRTPANFAVDGPLLGNGDMLAAISGPPQAVVFHLGKNDFWRLQQGNGNAAPQPVGTFTLSTADLVGASYQVNQSLVDATTRLNFDRGDGVLRMESRVLAQENLLLIGLTAEQRSFEVVCGLTAHSGRGSVSASGDSGGVLWIERAFGADVVDIPTKVACAMTTLGGSTSGQVALTIAAGETVWVAVSMDSLFKSTTPRDDVIVRCAGLLESDIPGLIAAHAAWWAGYWDKAWIEIGDPEIELAYYRSYYGMGSCSRDPEFPPAIFGWTTTNNPRWNGDYHTNYNFQTPFYALASGNRLEQLTPHDAPVFDFMSRAQGYATDIFGSGTDPWGVIFGVGIGPKGIDTTYNHGSFSFPNKEQGVLTFGQRSDAALCLVNMADRWRRSYDPAYGEKVYPFAKEVAAFWENYLVWDAANSRYVINNDSVHEGSGADFNSILSLGLIRNTFDFVLDLSNELDRDADKRAAWQDILEKISGYTTHFKKAPDGSSLEVFRYSEVGTSWWSSNTLGIKPIFPAGSINYESDPNLVQYARNTIEVMQRWNDSNGSNSFFPAAVQIGYEPRVILNQLGTYVRNMYPNGFLVNNPHGIENFSTVPSTINEMLCMSRVAVGYSGPTGPFPARDESILRLFPVWPRERDARFTRLRAWGGFLVSSSLWAGEVQFVELTSEQGRDCIIRNPWPGQAARLYRNGETAEVVSGATFSFATSPDETIRLFPGEHALSEEAQNRLMRSPSSISGTPVGGQNLSFESGITGWTVNGGTSTFDDLAAWTSSPLPDGSHARGIRANDPGDPISISQDFGPAATGTYLVSFHVADRINEKWLNYRVELLAGDQVLFDRDSATDPSLRPPNGSTSHLGAWGQGGTEGSWHKLRLQAEVPVSLAGQTLTLRFTSSTQSTGDDGNHHDFALDHVALNFVSDSWPLKAYIQKRNTLADGSTEITLNWLSSADWTYRVESSSDLQPLWNEVLSGIEATPPVNSITMTVPPGKSRLFFRVMGW
ncbi:hypothetical protein HW115_17905 [Verrucomicrobiaceae bacterium N1E253]|uniref:Glycosyl hydrolase family 95 catalytic domain-containing protein n=1 Tax=Oceaniferula marina TaxID=2748318 RepID=A0A851GR77_9BACT|nr:hypothetical protein [Oceaniferula marina]NWK57497.1 hypothetical protein [Oceaniferula marina]